MSSRSRSRSPRRSRSRSRSPPRRSRSPPRRSRSRSPAARRGGGGGGGGGAAAGGADCDVIELEGPAVAYILGRDGQTKRRLENATECRVEVNTDNVEIHGSDAQRDLCKLCVSMTLQQRDGRMTIDFKDLERRDDCATFDVPKECVGFVLGARGATLRQFEERARAYLVFDNEQVHDGNCKRIYILAPSETSRESGLQAVKEAVEFKQSGAARPGAGRGGGGGGGGGYGGGDRRDDRRDDRYGGGGGGGYRRDRARDRDYDRRRDDRDRDRDRDRGRDRDDRGGGRDYGGYDRGRRDDSRDRGRGRDSDRDRDRRDDRR